MSNNRNVILEIVIRTNWLKKIKKFHNHLKDGATLKDKWTKPKKRWDQWRDNTHLDIGYPSFLPSSLISFLCFTSYLLFCLPSFNAFIFCLCSLTSFAVFCVLSFSMYAASLTFRQDYNMILSYGDPNQSVLVRFANSCLIFSISVC